MPRNLAFKLLLAKALSTCLRSSELATSGVHLSLFITRLRLRLFGLASRIPTVKGH